MLVMCCVTTYTESLKAPKTVPNDPKVLKVNLKTLFESKWDLKYIHNIRHIELILILILSSSFF